MECIALAAHALPPESRTGCGQDRHGGRRRTAPGSPEGDLLEAGHTSHDLLTSIGRFYLLHEPGPRSPRIVPHYQPSGYARIPSTLPRSLLSSGCLALRSRFTHRAAAQFTLVPSCSMLSGKGNLCHGTVSQLFASTS
jgi:hypothetical protein